MGYIAPHREEILDWNIEHDYQYDLVVGSLQEIRGYAVAHCRRPSLPAYHFTQDRNGWWYIHATDAGWPIKGELKVHLDQDDPQLISPVEFFHAADASTVVIQAASHTSATDAQLFWRRLGDNGFSEKRSVAFHLTSDEAVHTYRITMSGLPLWTGSIVQLRLDPISAGGKEQWISLKSVSIERP